MIRWFRPFGQRLRVFGLLACGAGDPLGSVGELAAGRVAHRGLAACWGLMPAGAQPAAALPSTAQPAANRSFLRGMTVSCPGYGRIWGSRSMTDSMQELVELGRRLGVDPPLRRSEA